MIIANMVRNIRINYKTCVQWRRGATVWITNVQGGNFKSDKIAYSATSG